MQLSGDLGNRGHTELLVKLTQPRFDLLEHGLIVGNNLLRAYVELGMFAEARKLLEQLYSQQRPDWREQLIAWEQKLDDAQKRYGEVTAPLEVVVMKLEQPVWARGVLGFDAVLPAKTDCRAAHSFRLRQRRSQRRDRAAKWSRSPPTISGASRGRCRCSSPKKSTCAPMRAPHSCCRG